MAETEKLVPKRRFKEFVNCGAWEQRKLGEVVDVRSGKDYKHLQEGSIPVYGTGGYMLSVNEALSYLEDAIGIGRKGTIDKPYILKAPFWTVDTLFYAFPRETNDLNFVFDIFQNIDWKKKDESTGVPSLSKTSINEIDVLVPKTDEQRIIGAYFAKIDNLITLHQSKVEKIKALKSAYLFEMFPAEGECRPKRRFAGFTEDWEQRKLGEVCSEIGDGLHSAPIYDECGDYFFINGNNLVNGKVKINLEETPKVSKGTFQKNDKGLDDSTLLLSINGTIGNIAYYRGELIMLGKSAAYLKCNLIDKTFLFTSLQTNTIINKFMVSLTGTTIKNLGLESIKNTVISLPPKEEQHRLGQYFTNLDNLITLHQQKLEKLQNIKKAFLNEMFI